MTYLKCDRCNVEYRDQESIDMAKKGEEDWKKMCEKDGDEARGLFPCPVLSCTGEMKLVYEAEELPCPHCGKMIEFLNVEETRWISVAVMLGSNGKLEYNDVRDGDISTREFQCPECDWIITTDEEEALRFLKSEVPAETKEAEVGQEEKKPEEG